MRSSGVFHLIFFIVFSLVGFHGQAQAKYKKTNIIFILADDLGWGDLGCYGNQKIETPNLDRLANNGARYTRFYSASTVCAPARASMMSGKHTGHSAVRGNKTFKPEGQTPLPDSVLTIAMDLQKAGYATAAFGKWGLGYITTSGDPHKKGFDRFYGYNCQSLAHNYYPDHLWDNHQRIDLPGNQRFDSVYSADLIHQKAVEYLRSTGDQPFFLFLPYTLPHAELIVPADEVYQHYVKKFGESPREVKASDRDKRHFDPYPHAAFAAMVSRLDRFVGEILQAVKEKGLEENTLIIFSSDNGPHRENGGDPVFFNSNGGLRGIKRDLYEGGIRVPFIAYQKGVTKKGTVNDQPFILHDLYPTFLELAGARSKKELDGISMLPSIKGTVQRNNRYLYWEFHEQGGKQAVLSGKWKAVRLNLNKEENPAIELYDLEKDPKEAVNQAAQFPQVVEQMHRLMKEAYRPNPDWPLLAREFVK